MPTNKVEGAKILDPKDVFLSNEPKDIPPLPGQLDIEEEVERLSATCMCKEHVKILPMSMEELHKALKEFEDEQAQGR